MTLTLIWAQAKNGVIGNNGTIPWYLPEDLKLFRKATADATVIMGRKTWDSLPTAVRPLPGRNNIVVTSNHDWFAAGATRSGSLEEALAAAAELDRPVYLIGGGELYRQSLPLADKAIVTVVDLEPAGDTFAPELTDWTQNSQHSLVHTSSTGLRYTVTTWHRTPTE